MGTKTRDLSKLGAGFVVDGTKSRIDSDNTIETFTTLSVKRDNATYNSGKDSDIFVVNPDQANPTIETRHSTQIKDVSSNTNNNTYAQQILLIRVDVCWKCVETNTV